MHKSAFRTALVALVVSALAGTHARAADEYNVDPMHTGISFKISHLGLSWVFGTFKSVSGEFVVDAENPSASSFALSIKPESVDTAFAKRDDHLRGPDFFDVKQFPAITFKSTSVKAVDGGFEVTGDFTMHGTTKPITFVLKGGRKAEFPKGVQRTGYSTELVVKRSDYGVRAPQFAQALGDDVFISVSFEGTRK